MHLPLCKPEETTDTARRCCCLIVRTCRRMLLHTVVWFLAGSHVTSAAPYIQATVELSMEPKEAGLAGGGKPHTHIAKCTFGAVEWWIENLSPDAPRTSHYDGTNVYCRLGARDGSPLVGGNDAGIPIWIFPSPGGHPLLFSVENIVWLAFCSGQYLRQPGRDVPIPTATFARHWPENFAYMDKTLLFAETPGVPKLLELYTSHVRYRSAVVDQRLFRDYSPFNPDPKFPDGELQFRYEVEEKTNFLGQTVPLRFRFESFSHNRHGGNVRGMGNVCLLQQVGRPTGVFDSQGRYTIADWRFRDAKAPLDGIIYQKTNIVTAPATNEAELRRLVQERLRLQP